MKCAPLTAILFLLLLVSVSLLLLASVSSATMQSRNCTSSYAWTNMTLYINDGGNVSNIAVDSVPVYCKYGCAPDGLDCAEPAQNDSGMLFTICSIIGIVAFFLIYISRGIKWGGDKYAWPVQNLFFFVGLLFAVLDVALITGFNTFTQTSLSTVLAIAYMSIIAVLLLSLGAFFILLVIKGREWLTGEEVTDEK